MNYEDYDNVECAVLGEDDIKKEDLIEKCRPSVLQLAGRFEDKIVKCEETDEEEIKEKSVRLGSSIVEDVTDKSIRKKVKKVVPTGDSPGSAATLGSQEEEKYLVKSRGTKSGSEEEENSSIPSIIYSWLGDFFPALLYLLTPFIVLFLAFIMQFLWTTFVPSVQLDVDGGEFKSDNLAELVQE